MTALGHGLPLRADADDTSFFLFLRGEGVGVAVTAVTAVTWAFASMSVGRFACAALASPRSGWSRNADIRVTTDIGTTTTRGRDRHADKAERNAMTIRAL